MSQLITNYSGLNFVVIWYKFFMGSAVTKNIPAKGYFYMNGFFSIQIYSYCFLLPNLRIISLS